MSPIKSVVLFLIFILILSMSVVAEGPVLSSCGNADDVISATSFADYAEILNPSQAENYVALGLMYNSTGGKYLPNETLSNSLALKLVFSSVGREQEAEELAYNGAERSLVGLGKYDNMSWADGYYILALKEGLINSEEFTDAYMNPDSPIARDKSVSAQNIIKWMTIAHNIFLDNYGLPSNIYIDPAYKIYYASLLKYGFFTPADVEYFAPWRYITRDDTALLLEKFEPYILPALGMKAAVGTVKGVNIKFSGDDYVRSIYFLSQGTTYLLRSNGRNINAPFEDISDEIIVFGKGQPDISGILRSGDKIKVYYKGDKVLFIRVTEYQEKEEYKPSPLNFSGSLYAYDHTSNTLSLNSLNGIKSFYLSNSLNVYKRTEQIPLSELFESGLDSECNIYADTSIRGGLHRVYSIIIN